MCLLAVFFEPDSPIALRLAANREEAFDRPASPPRFDAGPPAVICGRDQHAGGTWLGVNRYGLAVGITNRPLVEPRAAQRSRGLLCRELLNCRTATEARQRAQQQLATLQYDGCNLLCIDRTTCAWIAGGDEILAETVPPGLHLLANGDLNDPRDLRLERARALWTAAAPRGIADFRACSRTILSTPGGAAGEPPILLRGTTRGTVSSTLITIGTAANDTRYWYSAGPPDRTSFEDYSEVLRAVLTADE